MHILHLLAALLIVAIWGFNFVVIQVGMEEIPPFVLGFARFFLTSIPAVFFIKKPAVPFKMIAAYGFFMFALQHGLLFMGMYMGSPPGLSSLLTQLQVFFTLFLAVIFFKEKIHFWHILGALVAFSGIAVVGINVGGDITLLGFFLVLASAASWGLGNVISKKIGNINMLALVIWGSMIAWPPLLLVSWLTEGTEGFVYIFEHLTWTSSGAVLYIAYLSTLVGFGLWSFLIYHHCLTTIAPFSLLTPIFAILSSVLVLDEPLPFWKILAGLLVIAGLCINLAGPHLFKKKIKD